MSDVLELWNSAPKPDELTKAMQDGTHSDVIIPKGAIIDPLNAAYFGGTRGKPTSIPYTTLRRMAQIPAIAAVINTRLNQVANHAKRPKFSGDKGFKIALKDRDAKMDDAKRKRAKEIEDFFLKTGWEKNKVRKDNFNQYLRKLTRDTLTLDVMTFEKVNKVGGALKGKMDLAEIWAIDAATIELVLNNPIGEGSDFQIPVYRPETKSGIQNIGEIAYVQKVNGTTVAEYTEDELAFAIRNPRTDLEFTDFGMSELETLIEIVTGIVNGIKYNTSYFSSSSLPQGVLSIVGKYKDEHLKAFQRHWKTLTEGAAGKWAVPVMASEDGTGFNWTPFKNSNRDMEFNQFLEFLFNIACAVYQIDPNEVGFKSWTSNSGGMSQSDNTAEKNDMSKDKGFVPLMTFLSDTFNSEIVDLIDDEFEFQWIGVDEEDEDKKLERIKNEIDSGIKVPAMVWKELDADVEELKAQNGGKLPDWAYAPANAQLIQVYTAGMQAQQQQAANGTARRYATTATAGRPTAASLQWQTMQHKKQLEVMDKQHQQGIEQNQLQQKAQQQGELKKQGNEFDHQKEMADIQHSQTERTVEGRPETSGGNGSDYRQSRRRNSRQATTTIRKRWQTFRASRQRSNRATTTSTRKRWQAFKPLKPRNSKETTTSTRKTWLLCNSFMTVTSRQTTRSIKSAWQTISTSWARRRRTATESTLTRLRRRLTRTTWKRRKRTMRIKRRLRS
jgi:hypothetical protein